MPINNIHVKLEEEDKSFSNIQGTATDKREPYDAVSENEIQSNKVIILEETNGNLLNDKKLLINAAGLVNGGLRRRKDGITNFGPVEELNSTIINDYLINLPPNLIETIPTLFSIKFNTSDKAYYLSPSFTDAHENVVLFILIDSKLKINKKLFISLGEIHFSVEQGDLDEKLSIEMTYDSNTNKHFEFDGKDSKIVTIGRGKKCDISLHPSSYSRIQTTFTYDEDEKFWYVQDGNGEKLSTNGTWVFLNWDWKIEENIQFRIGQSLLKIGIQ